MFITFVWYTQRPEFLSPNLTNDQSIQIYINSKDACWGHYYSLIWFTFFIILLHYFKLMSPRMNSSLICKRMKPLQLNISIEFGVFPTNYYMKLIWDYSCDENVNATENSWYSDFYGNIAVYRYVLQRNSNQKQVLQYQVYTCML